MAYTDFHEYTQDKRRKLRLQAEEIPSKLDHGKNLFKGLVIHVNGWTGNITHSELRDLICGHGGKFEQYDTGQNSITHIITSNLSAAKLLEYRQRKVVTPQWIIDSVKNMLLLPWQNYQHPAINISQPILTKFLNTAKQSGEKEEKSNPIENILLTSTHSSHHKDENLKCQSLKLRTSKKSSTLNMIHRGINSNRYESKKIELKTHEDQFLGSYYKHSRLHFLSIWKAELRKLAFEFEQNFPNKFSNKIQKDSERIILHVDMDCFFASVAIRNHPDLINKPVAVCHSNSNNSPLKHSTSEIASCNYPARAYGVANGMLLRTALEKCPVLVLVPYEFEIYAKVFRQLYAICFSHANKLQAVSCDEVYIEVSHNNNNHDSPVDLANKIREEIFSTTKCPASIGIGRNMLMARLATGFAKPNGSYFLETVPEDLPVKDFPGVGYKLYEKLQEKGIHTVNDLLPYQKRYLVATFGQHNGECLFKFARGIDDRQLSNQNERKSIGADVNWGVRFNNDHEFKIFVKNLAKEVSKRLDEENVGGNCLTLKLMKRKYAEEPEKYLGHGPCFTFSRSYTSPNLIYSSDELERNALALWKALEVDAMDIRGIGLQVTKLGRRPVLEAKEPSTSSRADLTLGEIVENNKPKTVGSATSHSFALPPLSQIDLSVLAELPIDIRKEFQGIEEHNSKFKISVKPQSIISAPSSSSSSSFATSLGGRIEINDLRDYVSLWMRSSIEPLQEDIGIFKSFLTALITDEQFEKCELLLKWAKEEATNSEWKDLILYCVKHVNNTLAMNYGYFGGLGSL